MSEPTRNVRINKLAEAPTPQNTPATATSSFIQRANNGKPSVPTISEDGDVSQLSNNQSLISMIQGKLGTLVGAPSGYIDGLPKVVKDRIRGLKALQSQQSELEAELEAEILKLEKQWHKRYEPLFKKRAQLIAGEIEPTEEEILAGKKIEEEDDEEHDEDEEEEEKEEEEDDEEDSEEDSDVKGIPDFWLTALKTHPDLSLLISDRDDEALHYLTDIRMDYLDQPGFALNFDFAENPFFTNKTLRKVYYYEDAPAFMGEYTFDHPEGTVIDWKSPEQNLTVRIEKRKQRNKRTQETRTVEKTVETESFFNFFSPPIIDEETEDDEELAELVEQDHQNGEYIKDMIPRAVLFFTGEALQYDEDDEDEDDLESLKEEDFSDSDEDEDDDEGLIKSGGGASGGQQPECKQQ
jgi:nucleosome assembly protein 1-like 1